MRDPLSSGTDRQQTTDSRSECSPVMHSFSKEQLVERAKEFMHIHIGPVRGMTPSDQKAYHETLGILMFYIDHVWKPFS